MDRYSLKHLHVATVVRNLLRLMARECSNTADVIAHVAEIDDRDYYADVGYRSMHAWCVDVLHLSDDAAYKRITAARVALKFPALFPAVADGRLHLTAVITLAPVLNAENVDRWIIEATHKTRREIEWLIAQQHPKADLVERVRRLPSRPAIDVGASNGTQPAMELAPERVAMQATDRVATGSDVVSALRLAPSRATSTPARVTPLAPARFGLQLTIDQATHDKLRRAQELMGHTTRPGDLAKVIDRALDALIAQLEKRKLAVAKTPRGSRPVSENPRSIPAEVKRAVRTRDGDRCAFVSNEGRRCAARSPLEFDHIVPVAQGGTSTISNVRQLCRTHNRLEAERRFGREFMRGKIAGRNGISAIGV